MIGHGAAVVVVVAAAAAAAAAPGPPQPPACSFARPLSSSDKLLFDDFFPGLS